MYENIYSYKEPANSIDDFVHPTFKRHPASNPQETGGRPEIFKTNFDTAQHYNNISLYNLYTHSS